MSGSSVPLQQRERERVYEQLIDHSGIEITPPEAWLLGRIGEREPTSMPILARQLSTPPDQLREPLEGLVGRDYIRTDRDNELELTESGRAVRERLIAAGREELCRLLDGWEPHEDEELRPVLRRLAGALVLEMPVADTPAPVPG